MASPPIYRVSTVLQPPLVMEKDGGTGYEGYVVDLLDHISKQAGFKYNLVLAKDGQHGRKDSNGRWDGMIGEVVNREADIAAGGLIITSEREKDVDFTKPFMGESMSLLMRKPTVSEYVSPTMLFEPFSTSVWLCILFAIISVAILYMVLGRFNPYEWRQVPEDKDPRGARHSFGLRESLMFVFSTVTLQGYRETPRSLSGRVLSVAWFIFIFLTVVAYIGNVVAFTLAGAWTPMPIEPFENIEDLSKDASFKVGVVRNSWSLKNLQTSSVGVYNDLARKVSIVNSTKEGVEMAKQNSQYVMIMETSSARYAAEHKPCTLMVYGKSHFSSGFGLAVRRGSSLRDPLSEAILRLREDGTLQMLEKRWWNLHTCFPPQLVKRGSFSVQVMGIRKMAAPFIILLLGAILSVIVLIGEVVFRKLRPPSQSQTTA